MGCDFICKTGKNSGMAVFQKGAISFGLVYIPVSLYTATQDNDVTFNQLHKADKSRIRYKKVCAHCGKEVKPEDIVRGNQYAKDQYVVITDEEIEKIKTEKDRTITIMSFVELKEISPLYYDRAYHVVPQKGGGKALELLRRRRRLWGSPCSATRKNCSSSSPARTACSLRRSSTTTT